MEPQGRRERTGQLVMERIGREAAEDPALRFIFPSIPEKALSIDTSLHLQYHKILIQAEGVILAKASKGQQPVAPIKGLRKIVSRYETCPLPLPLWRWDIIIRSKFREWRRAWTRGIHDIRSDIFSKGVARDGWREYGENVSIEKV